jgi:ABC-type branched-subunit amino acid transport system permease subunit
LILKKAKNSALAGFIGSLVAYFPLFIFLQSISSVSTLDILVILLAAGLISLLGGLGGYLGFTILNRNAT